MEKGLFITFEGGEGSGKSEQVGLLTNYLKNKGYEIYVTREPGGDPFSEEIRNLLQNPKYTGRIEDMTELLLFEASRSQFVQRVVKPRLKKGITVISDRFFDSTTAYQGYGRGIDLQMIKYLNKVAAQGLNPNITFLLDISAKKGLEKMSTSEFGKKDRIENEKLEFHEKVNTGYKRIATDDFDRVKVIPYKENEAEKMHDEIVTYMEKLLK